ncbi:TetR family transcriptional regulator [Longispora fulva]|uniref:AcrR family transcriptional regulator n=1 Tax=Longispora fulva TaxID=619741 RepID=A0A8J7GM18_9ACTN|nr:TetR family transcriptional regulator [Longispora fulva]MBG6140200.1 AcrR family transcriptional regulator [Longispora fulva]GIG57423.1 TetR family transcriptional regulator [Longispora fulva]
MPPKNTRESLLAAARAEFAAHGLAGARIDRIASEAGCNKERIYANFGNKDRLYELVLAEAIEEIGAATLPLPGEDAGAYVGKCFDFHREHPHLLRILLWEALQTPPGGEVHDAARRGEFYEGRRALLSRVLGTPPGVDPGRMMLVLIGLAAWPHAVPTLAGLVTGGESATESGQRELREFVTEAARRVAG